MASLEKRGKTGTAGGATIVARATLETPVETVLKLQRVCWSYGRVQTDGCQRGPPHRPYIPDSGRLRRIFPAPFTWTNRWDCYELWPPSDSAPLSYARNLSDINSRLNNVASASGTCFSPLYRTAGIPYDAAQSYPFLPTITVYTYTLFRIDSTAKFFPYLRYFISMSRYANSWHIISTNPGASQI